MKIITTILLVLALIGCQKEELTTVPIQELEPIPEIDQTEQQSEEQNDTDYTIDFKIFAQPVVTATYTLTNLDGSTQTETINYAQNQGRYTVFSYPIDDEIYEKIDIRLDFSKRRMTYYEFKIYYGNHFKGGGSGYSNWGRIITETF